MLEFLSRENRDCGEINNLDVGPHCPVAAVIEVHAQPFEHLLHGVGVAVVKRGIGEQSGALEIQKLVIWIDCHDFLDEIGPFGPITHNRHISAQHVDELWQLVQMVLAEEFAHRGKTLVVFRA